MTTRSYEALVIFKAVGTDQDIARSAAQLEEPIKKIGGRIETNQSMGRRKLAFRIARQVEGHYYLLRFQAPTAQVRELERLFRLNEAIVRFMILLPEEDLPLKASAGGADSSAASSRSVQNASAGSSRSAASARS